LFAVQTDEMKVLEGQGLVDDGHQVTDVLVDLSLAVSEAELSVTSDVAGVPLCEAFRRHCWVGLWSMRVAS